MWVRIFIQLFVFLKICCCYEMNIYKGAHHAENTSQTGWHKQLIIKQSTSEARDHLRQNIAPFFIPSPRLAAAARVSTDRHFLCHVQRWNMTFGTEASYFLFDTKNQCSIENWHNSSVSWKIEHWIIDRAVNAPRRLPHRGCLRAPLPSPRCSAKSCDKLP